MIFSKISIVMSVYNSEKYLIESIDSILSQTFIEFEFIIVNDGSTDNSVDIIKSYNDKRIILINQVNVGAAKARNEGIKKAKSNLIAILDADDIAQPERLQKQYQFLSTNFDYVIVGSNAKVIDMNGDFVYNTELKETNEQIKKQLPAMPFVHPSIMFSKDAFFKAGQYPEQMLTGQDYVLINRMARFGKFYNIQEALIKYRIVPNSNSLRSNKKSKRISTIMNKAIDNNKISIDDFNFLKSLYTNQNFNDNMSNYYLLLAKKYLWNNYQPKHSRRNLIKSFQRKPSMYVVVLFFISVLPSKFINHLYSLFKKKN